VPVAPPSLLVGEGISAVGNKLFGVRGWLSG
jgi:hypothetical protein